MSKNRVPMTPGEIAAKMLDVRELVGLLYGDGEVSPRVASAVEALRPPRIETITFACPVCGARVDVTTPAMTCVAHWDEKAGTPCVGSGTEARQIID